MINLKTMLKGLSKVLLALLILTFSLYLLLWAMNLKDEEPSAQSLQLQRILQAQVPVTDQDNGFIYYQQHFAQPLHLPDGLRSLLQCQPAQCLVELQAAQAALPAKLIQQQPVLNAYHKLLTFPFWQSPVRGMHTKPVALSPLIEMQQLYLLDVWLKMQSGEPATIKAMLQQDLRFWRQWLVTSNNPFDKSLAVSGMSRHFMFAKMFQQTLPAEQFQQFIPDLWRQPLTADELSLRLAMAGEWHFANSAIQSIRQERPQQQSRLEQWFMPLLWQPFLKPQAVSNTFARMHLACADQTSAVDSETYPWYRWLYNPIGKMLTRVSDADSCLRQHKALADLEMQRQQLNLGAL